ncbi:MAG: type II toxin-antitoxin system PemK/MazF family toxin [Sporichthyaceae bacterium]
MRGDIHQLRTNPHAVGHEQKGPRYAVVLQSDALPLSTVIAAPTSTGSWTSSFHPQITVKGLRSKVLVEQLQAVDVERRLGRKVGRVSPAEQADIDDALKLTLGLLG